jgi:GAF domain-containing protein
MAPLPALSQLTRLLVHSDGATLLDRLHEHLLEAAGGVASLVVHLDSVTATLRASSACRVEYLPLAPWAVSPAEQTAIEQALSQGKVVPLELHPASRAGQLLAMQSCLVVPLAGPEGPCGVILVGLAAPAGFRQAEEERVLAVADAFVLALERARLRRASDLQREVDRIVGAFRADAGSYADLNQALGAVCRAAARLFVAARAAAWLHDRRARELVLAASSEGGHGAQSARVAIVDSLSRAATALRYASPELGVDAGPVDAPPYLLVPLRGQRRALGVLEFEGVHIEPGDHGQVVEASRTLGHELAAAIENVLLFHQAVGAERELAAVFESISDLVLVCDAELRVVRGTRAFARRAGMPLADLSGRELRDLFGDALEARLHDAGAGDPPHGGVFRVEGTLLGRTVVVDASWIDSRNGRPAGLVLVVRDVSLPVRGTSLTPATG